MKLAEVPDPTPPRRPTRASSDGADLQELSSFQTRKRSTRASIRNDPSLSPLAGERYSVTHGLGPAWDEPVVYPVTGKKKTYVEFSDLPRLDEGEFLNDNLIEFYLRWVQETKKTKKADNSEVYFFGTHFYSKLTTGKRGSINHEAVARWTAKDDIFNYDYVVVPINESAHWYLALICNLPNLTRSLIVEDEPSDLKYSVEQILKDSQRTESEDAPADGIAGLSIESDKDITQPPSPTKHVDEEVDEISLVGDSFDDTSQKHVAQSKISSPRGETMEDGIFHNTKPAMPSPKKSKKSRPSRKYPHDE